MSDRKPCGMFWLALLVEFFRGKDARAKGEPRQCRPSPDYPALEKAFYEGYDAPTEPNTPVGNAVPMSTAKQKPDSHRRCAVATGSAPFVWPRSDPAALAKFDPTTKLCTMNCGQSTNDPRSKEECKFQCDDCIIVSPNRQAVEPMPKA